MIDPLGRQGPQATPSSVPIRTAEAIERDPPLELACDRIQSRGARRLPALRRGDLIGLVTPDHLAGFATVQSAMRPGIGRRAGARRVA